MYIHKCFNIIIMATTTLLIWTIERNTIKLHVKVFQRMDRWMFEICRRNILIIKPTRCTNFSNLFLE